MHYYRSTELADLYGVSRRTVTNWIKKAREGKLDLGLVEEGGDFYITKSESNQVMIRQIVQERRKYLNKRSRTYLEPKAKFYELYSNGQILDIIRNLTKHNELPLQYTYFDEGAKKWDEFRKSCGVLDAERLTTASMSYVEWLLRNYDKVNIVDIGVGNGEAARPLIDKLNSTGKLKRYIGIDISQSMLDIASSNIHEWFEGAIDIETHVKDVNFDSFAEIIAEAPNQETQHQDTINIVLLLGGHISNFRDPAEVLKVVNRSMNAEDLLLCNFKLGAPIVKTQLAFISSYQEQSKLLLDLMGIDESLYDVEIGFSEEEKIRFARIRLKRAATIEFNLPRGCWYVDLNKDETILTFRAHFNDGFSLSEGLFYRNGFHTLMTVERPDHQGMLLLADLKK